MSERSRRPGSLLDPKSSGGDIAEGGFSFQDASILARIPGWLAQDGFTSFLREGHGDVEARFFDPQNGERLSFIEFKNHRLTPAPFWDEIRQFKEMDSATPVYQQFELVCVGLSDPLRSLVRQLSRVREAFPFYDIAPEIRSDSFQDLVSTIEQEGGDSNIASFIFDKVSIVGDSPETGSRGISLFEHALHEAFPQTKSVPHTMIEAAYLELREFIAERRAVPISRDEIENVLWPHIPSEHRPDTDVLNVHTAHEERLRESQDLSVMLPWAQFFGGEKKVFPPPEQWNVLLHQLGETVDWINDKKRPRRINLTGHRRLSASLALGGALSAVAGFQLGTNFRSEIWKTDEYPSTTTPYPWDQTRYRIAKGSFVVVSIGLPRPIDSDVERFLGEGELGPAPHLSITSSIPLTSAADANAAVASAKETLGRFLSECGATKIHLFLAVPSPFALFLGHRLNATGSVQSYEYTGERTYTPTCLLP